MLVKDFLLGQEFSAEGSTESKDASVATMPVLENGAHSTSFSKRDLLLNGSFLTTCAV